MGVFAKLRNNGLEGSARKLAYTVKTRSGWYASQFRDTPKFADPLPDELAQIEQDLKDLGVVVHDLAPSLASLDTFVNRDLFPSDYHGGRNGGVWREKLLEHWLSADLLRLFDCAPDDIFVDVAAAASPWVRILRETQGLNAHAIDLAEIGYAYRDLPYYRIENATRTSFTDASVKGAALHCAFEMFVGEDDSNFVTELARILAPGGKAVILPLYMHTHHCAYSSPEYFGKDYPDKEATAYVRLDARGIPSSRKYDASALKRRILDHVESLGMSYRLSVLRNKAELGDSVYCHFVLEIMR
jgi:Methyltransferase domain